MYFVNVNTLKGIKESGLQIKNTNFRNRRKNLSFNGVFNIQKIHDDLQKKKKSVTSAEHGGNNFM